MEREFFILTLLAALAAMLVIAAVTDIRSRIIANWLNAAVAMLAPLFWLATGLSFWPDMALQIGMATAVFGLFTALFALGMMGGGDVKLLAALALWLPLQPMMTLLVIMSVLGGVVTLITIIHHKIGRRAGRPEVPYGVAISLAGLWVIGEQYINQFA